jgi:chromosome segregation ATPase
MNTAVSEDDLDDDEEEDEELGWDDDEEEVDVDREESVDSEQIEFRDQATEALQEELKQALAERDSLQQTVELQHKEIATLKEGESSNDQVEKLQTQLFEKESEMAAMQASLLDTSRMEEGEDAVDPKTAVLEDEVKRLTAKLAKSEASVVEYASELEACKQGATTLSTDLGHSKTAAEEASTNNAALLGELTALKAKMTSLKNENGTLVESLRSAKETETNLASSEETLTRMGAELEEVKAALVTAERRNQELKAGATSPQATTPHTPPVEETVIEKAESPETVSSGVRVEPPVVEKLDVSAEEGWDDDW